jgi:hypothetical protein
MPAGVPGPVAKTQRRGRPLRRRLVMALSVLCLLIIALWVPSAPAAAATQTATVEIVTVPAVPGARFSFDGTTYKADSQGVVRLTIPRATHRHTVALIDTKLHEADRDLAFVRWWYPANHDQDFRTEVTGIRIHHNLRIMAAFRASYLVSYSFADLAKQEVQRSRVARVEFFGDNGQTLASDGSGKVRMAGIRPVVNGGTLLAKQIRYSVQRVDVDGSNVVQVNQQVFTPSYQNSVVVSLLLRTAHFSTRDFLFGNPVGSAVRLTYPDKRQSTIPLDSGGKATVENLARGQYTVSVVGPGYSFQRPVALSRNQYIDLPIVTYLDMAVLGVIALVIIGALTALRLRTRRARLRAAYQTFL